MKSLRRRCHGRYGKGRHSAGLNFGDCFSYSLAKVKGEPLPFKGEPLPFKGEDFPHTDIAVAPY